MWLQARQNKIVRMWTGADAEKVGNNKTATLEDILIRFDPAPLSHACTTTQLVYPPRVRCLNRMLDTVRSDTFDQCLNLARKEGATGKLEPVFNNYYTDVTLVG